MSAVGITCSSDAAAYVSAAYPKRISAHQECFLALALDAQNIPIGRAYLVAVGSCASVEVHPRDVFRTAIKRNAVSIIVSHNHPSGNLTPSADDRNLTHSLKEAGKLLGIPLLDHLIMGSKGMYRSFADQGEM